MAKLAAAEQRIKELEGRLRENSSNSSRPPSSDLPGSPRRESEPSGRERGGQPGHKHHKRELLPPEQVSKVVECMPSRCRRCRARLAGRDAEPRRAQVIEVPPIRPHVTEYQQHELACEECGARTRGELPPEAAAQVADRGLHRRLSFEQAGDAGAALGLSWRQAGARLGLQHRARSQRGACGPSRGSPRVRAPAAGGARRRDRLARGQRPRLALDRGERTGDRLPDRQEPRRGRRQADARRGFQRLPRGRPLGRVRVGRVAADLLVSSAARFPGIRRPGRGSAARWAQSCSP